MSKTANHSLQTLQQQIQQHSNELSTLTETVREISHTLKLLTESQKSLSRLLEARIEHTVEINYIKKMLSELGDKFGVINRRLDALEKAHSFDKGEQTGRRTWLKGFHEYWSVMAIIVTFSMGSIYLYASKPLWFRSSLPLSAANESV